MKLVSPEDPILWTPASPVTDFETQVKPHLKWMRDFLIRTNGLGLTAPQVGVPFRFFLWRNIAVSAIINPMLTGHSDETDVKVEGCFSFPGKLTGKRRWVEIGVSYTDELNRPVIRTLRGMPARMFQHELDHLDGINLFPRPAVAASA